MSAVKTETHQILLELRNRLREIQDISHAGSLTQWFMETLMPSEGVAPLSSQAETLAQIGHQKGTAKELGALLDKLNAPEVASTLSKTDKALVRITKRSYDQEVRLPETLVKAMAKTQAEGQSIWAKARSENRYSDFAPVLEKMVDLSQQKAQALGYTDTPYNALLDLFEPDMTVAQLDPLFKTLKNDLVPLVSAISESSVKPDSTFVHYEYPKEEQLSFSKEILEHIGYSYSRGRLDESTHPFTTSFGSPFVVPITTRVHPTDLFDNITATTHEGGHGIYEQGFSADFSQTPLAAAPSLGLHESQSRLYENQVGRSKAFWSYFYPRLQQRFSSQLEKVSLDEFYKAINRSYPSFIRVGADEVTYNLHIMVRYDIEKALIEGQIGVTELPDLWNAKMKDYLGIEPKTDADGVLQDVHWSFGLFGYFPTYTLGNLYSAQFFRTVKKHIPDIDDQFARGDFTALKNWLNKEIHQYGACETAEEVCMRATGEPLNAQYFTEYLQNKFSHIYQLS